MNQEYDRVHDAEEVINSLRDNLAQHDKPISFLFGAGISCSVCKDESKDSVPLIPAVYELTQHCKKMAKRENSKFESAWSMIEEDYENADQFTNIELVLSRIRMIMQVVGKEELLGLKREEVMLLERCIRNNIAEKVTPELGNLSNNIPHRKFAKWLVRTSRKTPVEIFTLNYDVLMEYALESEQIPFFDGFVGSFQPFFNAESLQRLDSAPGPNWIRLWKMHGSVNWYRIEQDGSNRIIRGGLSNDGEMIYPSHEKYEESRQQPYSAFTDRLRRFLDLDDSMLIVSGYSFGDEHINQIIFGALENKPRTHVYALQYENLEKNQSLMKYASKLPNLIAIGPSNGIIGCHYANWKNVDPPNHLRNLMELSKMEENHNELINENNSENTGKPNEIDTDRSSNEVSDLEIRKNNEKINVRIGDFNIFCNFLNDMTINEPKED